MPEDYKNQPKSMLPAEFLPEAKMTDRVTIFLLSVLAAQCCVVAAEQCAMDPVRVDAMLQPLYTQLEVIKEQLDVVKLLATCPGAVAFADCTEGAMGMEDGRIPDSSITASSKWNNQDNHGPQRARLNTIRRDDSGGSDSWVAHNDDTSPWIQVDFQTQVHITGVITQGRNDLDQWVSQYQIAFSQDGSTWTRPSSAEGAVITFTGNADRNTEVTNRLPAPVNARFLRIYPITFHDFRSMRFEVIGCYSASDQP